MVRIVDENGIVRSVPDKPEKMRAKRWSNLKQQKGKDPIEYIGSEKHFSSSLTNIPFEGWQK